MGPKQSQVPSLSTRCSERHHSPVHSLGNSRLHPSRNEPRLESRLMGCRHTCQNQSDYKTSPHKDKIDIAVLNLKRVASLLCFFLFIRPLGDAGTQAMCLSFTAKHQMIKNKRVRYEVNRRSQRSTWRVGFFSALLFERRSVPLFFWEFCCGNTKKRKNN